MLAVSNRRHTIQKASPSDLPGQAGAERAITRVINQGWGIMDTGLMNERTQQMIAARSAQGVEGSLPWGDLIQHLGQTVPPMDTMIGKSITQEMAEIGTLKGGLGFNTVDALSIKYAQEQSGQLIRNITESQRATIRMITGKALSGDYTATQAARQIRQGIGLHPAWAQAVINYRGRLEALPAPKGMSAAKWMSTIDGRTDRYQARLVARRASTIARTEIITAENLGRYATWADSIGQGTNSPASRKEWDAGSGACPICMDLDGTVVPWDQEFPSPGGMMAPAHPNCRCSITLLPPDYENAALNPRQMNFTNVPETEPRIAGDYSAGQHLLDTAGEDTGGGAAAVGAGDDSAEAAAERTYLTNYDAGKQIASTQVQLDENLQSAVGWYQRDGYMNVNQALREELAPEEILAQSPRYGQKTIDTTEKLSQAISEQQPLTEPVTLYRGIKMLHEGMSAEPGSLFQELGFTSTAAGKDAARDFAGGYSQPLIMEIRVPEGTRVGSVRAMSRNWAGSRADSVDVMQGESEVLLDKGTTYRVLSYQENEMLHDMGITADHLVVEVVPDVAREELSIGTAEDPVISMFEADTQAAAAHATIADDLTYDSTLHWSDDKLMGAITKYADDPEAVDKILDIIDQREVVAAQRAAFQQYAESQYKPIIEQDSPLLNPAVRPARQLTADQRVEEEYQQYVYNAYDQAMEATNGVFFKKGMADIARAKGVDEISLFTGQYKTASKYASEELQAFWHANGRESLGSYRYKQLGRASDKWYADTVRNNGLDRGTISNDRSQF